MKQLTPSFDPFAFMRIEPFYCENENCEEFGYVTMVGIKKDSPQSGDEVTTQ